MKAYWVLVVDDDESVRRLVQRLLAAMGCKTRAASSYFQGLAALGAQAFDLLVTDVDLGDGTGLDLVARYKQGREDAPAVVMTGDIERQQEVERLAELGRIALVLKPFHNDAFRSLVQRVLDRGKGPWRD